jgi:predicted SnoaL-like aldol condensation-catalyzing enzyme
MEVVMKNLVSIKNASLMGFALAVLSAIPTSAQQVPTQANPTPGCTSTPAQLEAVKKVALDFAFLTGDAKIALADPSYRQHNPTQHKRAQDQGISDFESFKKTFLAAAAPGGTGGGGAAASTGPKPPEGNRAEIVLAQCDIVTVIHRIYRQDPTAQPGKFYEAFTFDSYRVKDGKVVEHWDDQVINPPAPAGRAQ